MRVRTFAPLISFVLLAACTSVPDLTETPVGVAGLNIYLPAPEGMVGVAGDTDSQRPRNAQLKAMGFRPLRHFLTPVDAVRAQRGLPMGSSLEGNVAILEAYSAERFSDADLARLQASVREEVAEFKPTAVEPDEELRAAWEVQTDTRLSLASIDIQAIEFTVAADGDDHICTLARTRQVSRSEAIAYAGFHQFYSSDTFEWFECWMLVNQRLLHLSLADESDSGSRERLSSVMSAWMDAIRQANRNRRMQPAPAGTLTLYRPPSLPLESVQRVDGQS